MGTTTDAVLAYGYNLGGDEGGWKITQTDEDDYLDPGQIPWYDEDHDDDFVEQAERRLLAASGFTETWETRADDDYFERERGAQQHLGVELDHYCCADDPMYVLAAKVITVSRGDCQLLDLPALARESAENRWDDKLRAAIEALGITPTQEQPGWVLASYGG